MGLFQKPLSVIERLSARFQGKGFGSGSIKKEVSAVSRFVTPQAVKCCVDIGGNVGNYTHEILHRFPNTTVDIFEPSRTNIEKLNQRFSKNTQVTIHPKAVSDTIGSATLYSNEAGSGLASLTKRELKHFGIDFNVSENVETIRFEDFWKKSLNSCKIDFVKLDIEGHEMSALQGFGEAIEHVSAIQFEFGGCNIDTRTFFKDFWNFFNDNNFRVFRITPFGVNELKKYKETDEFFSTTNYLAVASR